MKNLNLKKLFTISVLALLLVSMFGGLGVWQIKPAYGLYSTSGWELSGGTDVTDAGFWTGVIGSPTVVTSPVFAGTYAMRNPSGAHGVNRTLGATYSEIYVQTHVNFSAITTAEYYETVIITAGKASNWHYATEVSARKNATHVVFTMHSGAHPSNDSDLVVVINTDYTVELKRKTTSGTTILYVNGVEESSYEYEYYDADTVQIGGLAQQSSVVVFDNVVISDSPIGTAQTTSSVQLSSPPDASTTGTASTTFVYTPSCPDAIQNSSLWMNVSGTWQNVAGNSTTVIDKTLNNITYTIPVVGTYIWNVKVFNTTASVFASANYTITYALDATAPTYSVPATPYTSNKNWTSTIVSCLFNDNVNVSQAYVRTNVSGTWSSLVTLYPIWINTTACWANYTFRIHTTVGTIIGFNWTAKDTSNNWISGNTTTTYTLTVQSAVTDYSENAIWIYDQSWVVRKKNILTTNMSGLLNDMGNHSIKYAILFVGYFNGSTNQISYVRSDSIYDTFIAGCHARGIKAIAWGEDDGSGLQNITAGNRENIYVTVRQCMYKGFDGYSDDIESFIGTHQDQIDFFNNLTDTVHKMGKIHMPAVGYDWQQNTNMYLDVDFICTMFYSTATKWEDPQGMAYWQENFGIYGGEHGAPASPLILGLTNYEGFNQHSLPWQLNMTAYAMNLYSNRSMVGFCFWIYEYMAYPYLDDWQQWDYFRTTIATSTPIVHTITLNSTPVTGIGISYQGSSWYTPKTLYSFNVSLSMNASTPIYNAETHSSLFGCSDYTGSSGSGWSVYTYANGPYTLSSFEFINSTYVYTKLAGNIKVAIYNSTTYSISGWVGTNKHPHVLQTQSNATYCYANSWTLVNLTEVPLYAGSYFIVIKGETSLAMAQAGYDTHDKYGEWGHGQFITESYGTAFSTTFATIEGQYGTDLSAYIPTAPITYTSHYFVKWDDDSTNTLRTVSNVTTDKTFTIYYSAGTVEITVTVTSPTNTTYTSSISVQLSASGGTIDTILWNCTYTNGTVAYTNTVYTVATSMTLGNGSYIFNARANNTLGEWDEATVTFTVAISTVSVTVTIVYPQNITYTSGTISIQISASGGTIDTIWYNCKNGTSWIYGSNLTYTIPTSMSEFVDGASYTFYGWANNTDGNSDEETVMFTVSIYTAPPPILFPKGGYYYFITGTRTTNNVTGSKLDSSSGFALSTVTQTNAGNCSVSYAFTVYIIKHDGSLIDVTGITAIITRLDLGEGFQNGYASISYTTLALGYQALRVRLYICFDGGAWYVSGDYVTEILVKKAVDTSTWNFTVYTKRSYDAGTNITSAQFMFGDQYHNSRIGNVAFIDPLAQEIALWKLGSGDIIGGVLYPFMLYTGDLIYGLGIMFVSGVLYLRHKKWEVILVMFLLYAGGAGIGYLIPDVAYRLVYIVIWFVLTIVLYRVFR